MELREVAVKSKSININVIPSPLPCTTKHLEYKVYAGEDVYDDMSQDSV
jgi:hypothetical protein